MALRGIDTQIMVTRSADFARDASVMVKRPELTQEQFAAIQKMNAAHEQKKVLETAEAEMDQIRADKDGGGNSGGGEGSFGGGGFDGEEEAPSGGMFVPASDHVIDITI